MVYAVSQTFARPTNDRFRKLVTANVKLAPDAKILELGCGVGAYRDCFSGLYTGIDLNPGYVMRAQASLSGTFTIMDCTSLSYPDESFDEVVTIATTHHLNGDQLAMMVQEALRVCRLGGHLHVVDAILPLSPNLFKSVWFGLDRGRFPRKLDLLLAILGRAGNLQHYEVLKGPLHDVVYARIGR
jgi:SAM-dependent methyltransferase